MSPCSKDFIKKRGKSNYKGGGTRPKQSKENRNKQTVNKKQTKTDKGYL